MKRGRRTGERRDRQESGWFKRRGGRKGDDGMGMGKRETVGQRVGGEGKDGAMWLKQ